MSSPLKACTKCRVNPQARKGQSWCKACLKQYRHDWGVRNKEKLKAYAEEKKTPASRKHLAAYYRQRLRDDPEYRERRASKSKGRWLRRKGITRAQYEAMVQSQHNLCAICGEPETVTRVGRTMSLNIDHDHKTGRVRGLLCGRCNRGLGSFTDSIAKLEAAITYLQRNQTA